MTYTEFRTQVIAEVARRLKGKPGYRGVCCDTIQDSYRQKLTVSAAANIAEDDTRFWDKIKN